MTTDDTKLIAEALIRTGRYVSRCDDADNSLKSRDKEKTQLVRALTVIAKVTKTPYLRSCAECARTLPDADVDDNADTAESLATALERAVDAFARAAGSDEVATENFRKAVMFVGASVARAYREELDQHEEEFILESLAGKIAGDVNEDSDPKEFKNQNISPAEDAALTIIAKAVKAKAAYHANLPDTQQTGPDAKEGSTP